MRRNPRSEAAIVADCLAVLRMAGAVAWRMNTGAATYTDRHGRKRMVRYGRPGMADIAALYKGRMWWIECKAATGKQTMAQRLFQEDVEKYGAPGCRYVLARSAEDVIEAMGLDGFIMRGT